MAVQLWALSSIRACKECAKRVLPPQCQVTLLAARGFEHGNLIHWLRQQNWSWAIRVKSDLKVTLASGRSQPVEHLLPPAQQAYLFENVQVLDGIRCHLVTAKGLSVNKVASRVLSYSVGGASILV